MGRGAIAFGCNLFNGFQCAVARRATCTECHRKKLRVQRCQFFARRAKFCRTFHRLWREKFKTEKWFTHGKSHCFLISCAAAAERAQVKILYSTAPKTPYQKLSTTKPRNTEPTNQNNIPLIKKMNNPNVISVTGKVSNSNSGRINVLTKPRKNAAINAAAKPSTCIPGTKFATANNASALSIQINSSFIGILPFGGIYLVPTTIAENAIAAAHGQLED